MGEGSAQGAMLLKSFGALDKDIIEKKIKLNKYPNMKVSKDCSTHKLIGIIRGAGRGISQYGKIKIK